MQRQPNCFPNLRLMHSTNHEFLNLWLDQPVGGYIFSTNSPFESRLAHVGDSGVVDVVLSNQKLGLGRGQSHHGANSLELEEMVKEGRFFLSIC